MLKLWYRDRVYTINELSEISGIAPATIRDRIRRGYSVEEAIRPISTHDNVTAFVEASLWTDWIGMSISYLHEIYWKWSIQHGYSPLQIQGFSRQLFKMYPNLKTVPTKKNGNSVRIIRVRKGY